MILLPSHSITYNYYHLRFYIDPVHDRRGVSKRKTQELAHNAQNKTLAHINAHFFGPRFDGKSGIEQSANLTPGGSGFTIELEFALPLEDGPKEVRDELLRFWRRELNLRVESYLTLHCRINHLEILEKY